jgi:hypothetical protein
MLLTGALFPPDGAPFFCPQLQSSTKNKHRGQFVYCVWMNCVYCGGHRNAWSKRMNMTKDTHVRLSTDQHERIKKAAHDRGVSISTYIRWAALEAAAKSEQG